MSEREKHEPAIKGLEPDDRIGWTIVTAEALEAHGDTAIETAVRDAQKKAWPPPGDFAESTPMSDVLVVAFPATRRRAVYDALDVAGTAKPWGHKITLSVYVEGDRPDIEDIQRITDAIQDNADAEFIGARLGEVAEEPQDQIAT